jgi:hypothetical protein
VPPASRSPGKGSRPDRQPRQSQAATLPQHHSQSLPAVRVRDPIEAEIHARSTRALPAVVQNAARRHREVRSGRHQVLALRLVTNGTRTRRRLRFAAREKSLVWGRERHCCGFLRFHITVRPRGAHWLILGRDTPLSRRRSTRCTSIGGCTTRAMTACGVEGSLDSVATGLPEAGDIFDASRFSTMPARGRSQWCSFSPVRRSQVSSRTSACT